MRLLGIDPGLRVTGWGVIDLDGNRLIPVAHGVVKSTSAASLARRLTQLYDGLCAVIEQYNPDSAAVEETFVNKNPKSTLLLGQARGVALLAPAKADLEVSEYAANLIKKSVVGSGHADKRQVSLMVHRLLPGVSIDSSDAADALAVAICHAHHVQTRDRWVVAALAAAR